MAEQQATLRDYEYIRSDRSNSGMITLRSWQAGRLASVARHVAVIRRDVTEKTYTIDETLQIRRQLREQFGDAHDCVRQIENALNGLGVPRATYE